MLNNQNRFECTFFCKEDALTSNFCIPNALQKLTPFSSVFRVECDFEFGYCVHPALNVTEIETMSIKINVSDNIWYCVQLKKIKILRTLSPKKSVLYGLDKAGCTGELRKKISCVLSEIIVKKSTS
jgi:hypothetical protein